MRGFIFFSVLAFWHLGLLAQQDTVLLPVVAVRDSLLPAAGTDAETWQAFAMPLPAGTSVAELLSSESLVFVKHSGPGQIATLSQSGGTSAQTAILWNGLPIQSPMLGLQDLSLLPAAAFSRLELTNGGSTNAYGTSGINGALNLRQSRPDSGQQVVVGGSVGSFGQQSQLLRYAHSRERLAWRFFAQRRLSDNDYEVRQPNFWTNSRLPHARWQQYNAQGELYAQLSPKDELVARYWFQTNERELPPDLRVRQNLAAQTDTGHRMALSWQHRQTKGVAALQLAWFREAIHYRDPLIGFDAPSAYDSYLLDIKTDHQIRPRWRLQTGLQSQWTWANAQEYGKVKELGRFSAHASLSQQWHNRPWTTDYSLRLGTLTTGQPLWSLAWRTTTDQARAWHWSVRIGRDFRLPGLNDLFWRPGGNPELEAEVAYAQEASLHHRTNQLGNWQLRVFNRWVHNWIQWSQLSSGLFAAGNINRVWSRGASLRWEGAYRAWQLQQRLEYVHSTYQEALENPNIAAGEQLWYTPNIQWAVTLNWTTGSWRVRYQHQYTGATKGISADLSAYQLGDLMVHYQRLKARFPWQLQFALRNCWNTNYQIIEFRPLPGRNLMASLQFTLQ